MWAREIQNCRGKRRREKVLQFDSFDFSSLHDLFFIGAPPVIKLALKEGPTTKENGLWGKRYPQGKKEPLLKDISCRPLEVPDLGESSFYIWHNRDVC